MRYLHKTEILKVVDYEYISFIMHYDNGKFTDNVNKDFMYSATKFSSLLQLMIIHLTGETTNITDNNVLSYSNKRQIEDTFTLFVKPLP